MSKYSLKEKASSYSEDQDRRRLLSDTESRVRKARKIKAVLDRENAFSGRKPVILDIGCSHGYILKSFSGFSEFCVGIDMDRYIDRQRAENIAYMVTDAEKLPFDSNSFDIVICNHVYEHTDNPILLMEEIGRILKPDGLCYFAGPSKYSIIEPHYHLPFLSWLPQKLADAYVKITGKGDAYYVHPASYAGFISLLRQFDFTDYTREIIAHPTEYYVDDLIKEGSVAHFIYRLISRLFPRLLPTYIFIIRPRASSGS